MKAKDMLERLLSLPTAPFHETEIIQEVEKSLGRMRVNLRTDRYGNRIARLKQGGPSGPPLALVAHMDHPGFVVRQSRPGSALVQLLGGLGHRLAGRRLKFVSSPECVGVISRVARKDASGRPTHVWVRTPLQRGFRLPHGTFGVWDVPAFRRRGSKIHARSIDDVCGVAVMLEVLRRLGRSRRPVDLYCCFTRAEEVGFVGAAGLARTNILPRRAKLISIEMSRELPGKADQGKGFVIRAGDRASLFDPGLVGFMIWIARRMQAARKTFQFQTAILDGGTCEATLFNAMGGCAAGVALPLRNYHNQAPDGHIAPECIDMHDLNCLVDFLEELAGQMRNWGQDRRALRSRLDRNFRTWRKYL
ncbi:MAG: hypothetical protein A3I06_11530 [Candidatus Lindowbacteria bacterium RIFCSPLOWO2_02_FULL_62_12]|nr:MAG: hypothetical protein A3I06_11530 [Candidatus Lindowbacteria bacterium RIFCSPLOWO2_02_FULL_62_12]